MKLTPVFIGLLLITNTNGGQSVNKEITWDLPRNSVELVEKSSFETLTMKSFSELSKSPRKPNAFSPNSCEAVYTAAMSACSALFWNPPAYAACAAAAAAAYAACLAATSY